MFAIMLLHILSIYKFHYYIYVFTIYSFIGWCLETPFHSILEKKFVNRGFLYGPFCPIYGVGCIFLIKFLSPLQNNLIILFFASSLVTSTLEYFTGYAMEKLFDNRWWDYDDNMFNLHGRICLKYSLFWGFGSVFVIKILHPFVDSLINNIPLQYSIYICSLIITYFIIDSVLTIMSIIKLHDYLLQLYELSAEIKDKLGIITSNALDKVGEMKSSAADIVGDIKSSAAVRAFDIKNNATNKVGGIKNTATNKVGEIKNNTANRVNDIEKVAQELKSRYENLIYNATSNSSRLIKAFPDLTSKKFNQVIKDIKRNVNNKNNQNKTPR